MWDKNFLSRLFRLGLPIMLQNLFMVLGNSVTTLMTGKLGDAPIAAAGLSMLLDRPPVVMYRDGTTTEFSDMDTDWAASFTAAILGLARWHAPAPESR